MGGSPIITLFPIRLVPEICEWNWQRTNGTLGGGQVRVGAAVTAEESTEQQAWFRAHGGEVPADRRTQDGFI